MNRSSFSASNSVKVEWTRSAAPPTIVGTKASNACITSLAALRVEIAGRSGAKTGIAAAAPSSGSPDWATSQTAASSGFAIAQSLNRPSQSAWISWPCWRWSKCAATSSGM